MKRDTRLITRRFEDILSSSSERKNSVMKVKERIYSMLIYMNSFAIRESL